MAAGLFTTPDLNSRVDIIRKALPDATVTPFGDNAIIEVDGKKMVLNKPGLSQADVADFGSSLIKFLPAGKAAQAASGAGKLAAVGVGAVASGATSVAEDLAAGLQGSGARGHWPESRARYRSGRWCGGTSTPWLAGLSSSVRRYSRRPALLSTAD